MPSIVTTTPDGSLAVGLAAESSFEEDSGYFAPSSRNASLRQLIGPPSPSTSSAGLTPRQAIVAMLRHLADGAAACAGIQPQRIVVAIPSGFPRESVERLRACVAQAGLELAAVVNEPLAIGIAHAQGQELRRTALVCEWGASGLRASILEQDGFLGETVFDVVSPALSDRAMINLVLQIILDQSSALDDSWSLLARAPDAWPLELLGRTLRFLEKLRVSHRENLILARIRDPRRHTLRAFQCTRAELERWLSPALGAFLAEFDRKLSDLALRRGVVREILLAGGWAEGPLPRQLLRDEFGIEPSLSLPPHQAVALGTALLGASLDARPIYGIPVDLSAHGISVGIRSGPEASQSTHLLCHTLIPAQIPLPAEFSDSFHVPLQQGVLRLSFFRGCHPNPIANLLVHEFVVQLPAAEQAGPPTRLLHLRSILDAHGQVKLRAVVSGTGNTIEDSFSIDAPENTTAKKALLAEIMRDRLIPGDGTDVDPFDPDIAESSCAERGLGPGFNLSDIEAASHAFRVIPSVCSATGLPPRLSHQIHQKVQAGQEALQKGSWAEAVSIHRALREQLFEIGLVGPIWWSFI